MVEGAGAGVGVARHGARAPEPAVTPGRCLEATGCARVRLGGTPVSARSVLAVAVDWLIEPARPDVPERAAAPVAERLEERPVIAVVGCAGAVRHHHRRPGAGGGAGVARSRRGGGGDRRARGRGRDPAGAARRRSARANPGARVGRVVAGVRTAVPGSGCRPRAARGRHPLYRAACDRRGRSGRRGRRRRAGRRCRCAGCARGGAQPGGGGRGDAGAGGAAARRRGQPGAGARGAAGRRWPRSRCRTPAWARTWRSRGASPEASWAGRWGSWRTVAWPRRRPSPVLWPRRARRRAEPERRVGWRRPCGLRRRWSGAPAPRR